MPMRSRILYHLMPSEQRKQLSKYVLKRHNVAVKMVQTEAWLTESVDDQPNY